MIRTNQDERLGRTSRAGAFLVRAWIAVALIPVFFILSFAVAQVLYSAMGYLPENTVPLWVDLVASISALVVFLLPCAAAVLYGRRADRAGDRRGLLPLALGALASVALLVLTVVTIVSTPHA